MLQYNPTTIGSFKSEVDDVISPPKKIMNEVQES